MTQQHVLVVVTSHDYITEEQQTGLWLPEFSDPYALFVQEGYEVTVASIRGGKAPVDPRSVSQVDDAEVRAAMRRLETTTPLQDVSANGFDAIFLPGGHGTMYDLPDSTELAHILGAFDEAGKVIAAVEPWASRQPCAINAIMLRAEDAWREVLRSQTLATLAEQLARTLDPRITANTEFWTKCNVRGST